MFIFQTR